MSTADDIDYNQLGNGRVTEVEVSRTRAHLALREVVLVVFECDKQWRRHGVQREWFGRCRHIRLHRYYILNARRRIGIAELPKQVSLGGDHVAV